MIHILTHRKAVKGCERCRRLYPKTTWAEADWRRERLEAAQGRSNSQRVARFGEIYREMAADWDEHMDEHSREKPEAIP